MGIGTFIFQLAMIEDMRCSLIELHHNATTTDKNGRQAVKQISAFIEFNLLVKKLSEDEQNGNCTEMCCLRQLVWMSTNF